MDLVKEAKLRYKPGVTFKMFAEKHLTHTIKNCDFVISECSERHGEITLSYGFLKYTVYRNGVFAPILIDKKT